MVVSVKVSVSVADSVKVVLRDGEAVTVGEVVTVVVTVGDAVWPTRVDRVGIIGRQWRHRRVLRWLANRTLQNILQCTHANHHDVT